MKKIPVGATIAHAYRFAFGQFFGIFGVVWLPWLILSAGGFLLMQQAMAFAPPGTVHDFSNAVPLLPLLIPFYLVVFVLLFMQIAGITELALGLNKGSPYYYFSLGRPLWRLIGAFLLLVLLIIIGLYVVVIICGVLLAGIWLAYELVRRSCRDRHGHWRCGHRDRLLLRLYLCARKADLPFDAGCHR